MTNTEQRPQMRANDPKEAAAARAAEIRGDGGLSEDDGVDEFATPIPPDGWSYEWKRKSTLNQEDHTHLNHTQRMGWTAVPVRRHPEMMQPGATGAIERKGLILMERPAEITDEVKRREYAKAMSAVQKNPMASRNEGLLGRPDAHSDPRTATKINKSYEPMQIPDK